MAEKIIAFAYLLPIACSIMHCETKCYLQLMAARKYKKISIAQISIKYT